MEGGMTTSQTVKIIEMSMHKRMQATVHVLAME